MSDKVNYPVQFSADEYADLGRLAETTGKTKAAVLRTLVREASKVIAKPRPLLTPEQITRALGDASNA